jgi:hypothetical protein
LFLCNTTTEKEDGNAPSSFSSLQHH